MPFSALDYARKGMKGSVVIRWRIDLSSTIAVRKGERQRKKLPLICVS